MNYEQFLTEKKSGVIKAAEKKAKDEMSSKGADRKSSAADKASSKNAKDLSKWGKAVWDVISKMNHGSIVKDTFNQSAADGTLDSALAKGLVKDKKESHTYKDFQNQLAEAGLLKRANTAKDILSTASDVANKEMSTGEKIASVVGNLGKVGTALSIGADLGKKYKNTNRAAAVSGRGAGRSTFNPNSSPGAKLDPK